MPHLINGDVNKQFPYPVYTLRQHVHVPNNNNNITNSSNNNNANNNAQNQYTLSNSVVMYDPSRGQYYTELA